MKDDQVTTRWTMTVPEAAALLGISKGQGYMAARTGELLTIRIGKRILVPVAALERLLQGSSPHEAILTTVGSKRVIAFYEPDNGRCAVHAVVYEMADAYTGATTAARVRISLNPREMVHIDSADNKSLNLQCGSNAETLSVVDNDELVAFGLTIQPPEQFMRANTSGF